MWHISIIITSADCSMMMHQSNSALRTPLINIILLYLTGNRWSHQILLSTFLNFGKDLLTVISLHWLAWKVDPVLIQNQLMVLERMETQKRKLNNWRRKQINALKVWLLFYMWYIFCSVNVPSYIWHLSCWAVVAKIQQFAHVFHRNISTNNCARELFKPLKDSASEKNNFWF